MIPKEYLTKRVKDSLDEEHMTWAKNIIALEYNKTLDTPEAKKQVDAATFNIEEIKKRITWLLEYQKTLLE